MLAKLRFALPALVVGLALSHTAAQNPLTPQAPLPPQVAPTPAPAPNPPPPPADAVAATVNGQKIPEIAVHRATVRAHPSKRAELRPEVINFLVDNALVDQYLDGQKVAADPKEVEKRLAEIKKEIADGGQKYDKVLENLYLTEADLRTQIINTLRWDKFVGQYSTDKAIKEFFDGNKTMFDGSQMKAKHVLVKTPAGDAKAAEAAKLKILAVKKQIEDQVAAGMKAVANEEKLAQEKQRVKLLEEAFAAAAKESDCPSKSAGGELGWFPRAGRMVEPFAKAAFALKPHELSGPVATEFGVHLILPTDHKPGRDVKFEDMKDVVKEVYGERMRDSVLAQMRPRATIQIQPAPKQ